MPKIKSSLSSSSRRDTAAQHDVSVQPGLTQSTHRPGDGESVDLMDSEMVSKIVRETAQSVAQDTGAESDDRTLDDLSSNAAEIARSANDNIARAAQD